MPMLKRKPFTSLPPPSDLKPDEEVFFLKLTNEIFRDYDEYFARVILCNSLVWSCSLTGKASLTFQEAIDSERSAKKQLRGFPRPLKKALFYLTWTTKRGKFTDLVEDVLTYARDRYFKGEEVLSVIGNMWCRSKVLRVIPPTQDEMERYKRDQIEKGLFEKNDYLRDDSWGPSPDLFRYEVQEIDPDDKTPASDETHILEAIDVKREKLALTRDKCRVLLKLATDLIEEKGYFMLKPNVLSVYGLLKLKYEDIFVGKPPIFDESPLPVKSPSQKSSKSKTQTSKVVKDDKASKQKKESDSAERKKPGPKKKEPSGETSKTSSPAAKSKPGPKSKTEAKPKKVEKQLTPQELKQLELEKKLKEREQLKAQRKLVADFKKLWFKPKEDLEVEDLKNLPTPDPVCCKIPNNLFGEFIMVLEFMNCYSSVLKVRDCFPSGMNFDILERALTKFEVAGPFSDIVQLLVKTIFRLQEVENAEITEDETQTVDFDEVNEMDGDVTAREAVQLATAYSTWSIMYQNTPLHKLSVDHLSITEVLRLHLLASGAKPSEKDVKWRSQQRGGYTETDDPGLQLRLEEPQIIKTLTTGTVFDLTMREKLKLLHCLINQITTYISVRDAMEESFELYKSNKATLRTLQAAEKKKDAEDNWWRVKLKTDKIVPDMAQYKAEKPAALESQGEDEDQGVKGKEKSAQESQEKPGKPLLTDEQIEYQLNKKDKEIARRKQDFLWKEAELQETILKHERRLGLHPLGRDRAYRRFWFFPTVAGLFVEHDDEFVGECLGNPTPYMEKVDFEDLTFVKETYDKYLQLEKEGGSDKENSFLASSGKSKSKKKVSTVQVKKEIIDRPPTFGVCTGDKENCPVHCTYLPRPKWSFYWNPEDIDALIENLTPRGIREKDLRSALVEEKDGIKGYLGKCPVLKLNREGKYPEHLTTALEKRPQRGGQTRKNMLDPNLNYPAGTSVEMILELQLRDLILEVEEKIFLGALGSLKVTNRLEWRESIENRGYDPQTPKLYFGGGKSFSVMKRKGLLNGNAPVEGTSKSDQMSSHTSTSSEAKEDQPIVNPMVKDLACAILQVRQSLEPKFVIRPLGEDDKDGNKKKKTKEVTLSEKMTLPAPTAFERWELSLMSCTSYSQLFVHLFTFENSVEWSRSVLNARCRVCRRKGNPENMLLCDSCNKGHHGTCLKPPIENIPKGDWFCYDCKPIEPPPKPRDRKRRLVDDEDILEELEREDSDDDGRVGRRGGRRSNEDTDQGVEDVCVVCSFGGDLISCEQCSDGYHLLCLNPPLSRPPRAWTCRGCKSENVKPSSSSSKKKTKTSSRRKIISDDEEETEDEEEEMVRSDDQYEGNSRVGNESDEDGKTTEDDDDDEDDDEDEDEDSSDREVVKVRFGKRNSGKRAYEDDDDYVDSEEERHRSIRGSRRKCASQAAAKIAQVAKRLRSDSKENESSENSNDSSSFGGRKRSSDLDSYENLDVPKRTRLQRMNTNNKVRNGELDNVLLDKVLSEVMKNGDAWPFLKPVTRQEAPDYHDIVKHPMDLGTIKYKLNSMVYTCNEEFISDLLLVFSNCEMYNQPDTRIFKAGQNLKSFCERKFSKIGIHISDSVN